jgi:hypothetical protein
LLLVGIIGYGVELYETYEQRSTESRNRTRALRKKTQLAPKAPRHGIIAEEAGAPPGLGRTQAALSLHGAAEAERVELGLVEAAKKRARHRDATAMMSVQRR